MQVAVDIPDMSKHCQNNGKIAAKKFRMICPACRAMFIVDSPQALVWEHCPACQGHVWDSYDALLADRLKENGHVGHDSAALSN